MTLCQDERRKKMFNAEIRNAPAKPMPVGYYLVARQDITAGKPTLWYYGCYADKERAEQAAVEIRNGLVLEVVE